METPRTTAALKLSPYLLSLLRITVGIVFIRHGMQLLFGFPFGGMNHDFTTLAGIGGVLFNLIDVAQGYTFDGHR